MNLSFFLLFFKNFVKFISNYLKKLNKSKYLLKYKNINLSIINILRLKLMKFKYTIILMILICFFISLAGVTASDNADIDNVTMIDEESSNLEISNSDKLNDNFETLDDLNEKIQNSKADETIKIDNDIYVSKDTKCVGIEYLRI